MPSYVVTGASRGLGYGFLTHLAQDPNNTVIGLVRSKPPVEVKLASSNLPNVHLLEADITSPTALVAAAKATASITNGTLDVLINNAAYIPSGHKTLDQYTSEQLETDMTAVLAANVTGVAQTINAFLPLIRAGTLKKVVTISSGMADLGLVNKFSLATSAPYSVSKAAVNAIVAKYNAALGPSQGILFFALSPGVVATEGVANAMADEDEAANFAEMGKKFVEYAPDFKGPISVQESVGMCMNVIGKASVETMGGEFVSHRGDKRWL